VGPEFRPISFARDLESMLPVKGEVTRLPCDEKDWELVVFSLCDDVLDQRAADPLPLILRQHADDVEKLMRS